MKGRKIKTNIRPAGIDYEHVLKEVSQLPPRNDTLYKWRAVRKALFVTFLSFVLGVLGVVCGLVMVYIDIYTPARIPFGWLLGLLLFALCVLSLLLLAPTSIITIVMAIKPTYTCNHDDVFDVVKSIKQLGLNFKTTIKDIKLLDDLSLQLVLPSSRNKLEDFFRIIDKTLSDKLNQHQNPNFPNKKVSYSTKHEFQITTSSYSNDNIICGVAAIDVNVPQLGEPKKVPFAEITVAAVKSDSGNWYLALPDLKYPELWIKFLHSYRHLE